MEVIFLEKYLKTNDQQLHIYYDFSKTDEEAYTKDIKSLTGFIAKSNKLKPEGFKKLVLISKQIILNRLNGEYKKSLDLINLIDLTQIKDDLVKLFILPDLIWTLRLNGKYGEAQKLIRLTYEVLKVSVDSHFDFSNHHLKLSESSCEPEFLNWINWMFDISLFKITFNHGVLYLRKGQLDDAIIRTKQGLKIALRIKIASFVADTFNNLGVMNQYIGRFEKAITYFEESIKNRPKEGSEVNLALAYLNLLQIYFEYSDELENNDTSILMYLDQLNNLEKKTNNKRVITYNKIGKALHLKSKNRLREKTRAGQLFEELIKDEDNDYQHRMLSYFSLGELLLYEFAITQNPDVYEELTETISTYMNIGIQNSDKTVSGRALLLQSRSKLLEGDLIWAKHLLNKAILDAEKMYDKRLLYVISRDYDQFLDEIDESNSFLNKSTVKEDSIEHLVESIILSSNHRMKKEIPIMFLIVNHDGNVIFSKTLNPSFKMNDMLIGNFINAFQMFGKEAFDTDTNLEIVSYQNFSIMLRGYEKLKFIYVFQGNSYYPNMKLKKFIDVFENNSELHHLLEEQMIVITKSLTDSLNIIFESAFA